MNIFVGNLSFDATQGDVKKLFEGFGNVTSVVIVVRKEKKVPKSRGFGFVEMPDEQQAFAAIAALNGKEFMGRVLNVNPTRPKTEAERKSELKKKMQPKVKVEAEQYPQEEREQKKAWINPVFNKHPALNAPGQRGLAGAPPPAADGRVRPSGQPGTYRGGRRTRSYISRLGLAGMQEETKPRQRSQDNPMRWRKRKDQPKPWQKSQGEHKPWKKVEGGARPWKKPAGEAKPRSKSSGRPQKSRFNPSTSDKA
jgi:RNA recognition motif-containing protein